MSKICLTVGLQNYFPNLYCWCLTQKSVSLYQFTSWSFQPLIVILILFITPLLYLEYRRMFTDNTDEENINYYGENKATTAEPQDNYIIVHYNLFNFRLCEDVNQLVNINQTSVENKTAQNWIKSETEVGRHLFCWKYPACSSSLKLKLDHLVFLIPRDILHFVWFISPIIHSHVSPFLTMLLLQMISAQTG